MKHTLLATVCLLISCNHTVPTSPENDPGEEIQTKNPMRETGEDLNTSDTIFDTGMRETQELLNDSGGVTVIDL
jgi:hypothetical protein